MRWWLRPECSSASASLARWNSRSGAPSKLDPTSSRSALRFLRVNGTRLGRAVARRVDEVLGAGAAPREDAEVLGVEDTGQANRLRERRRERRLRLGRDARPHPPEGLAAELAERHGEQEPAGGPGQPELAVDDRGGEVQRAVDVDLL